MKRPPKTIITLSCFFAFLINVKAEDPIPIYVSKQTGQFTIFQGAPFAKVTDRYEKGTITPSVQGPIAYEVIPNDLSIGPNQMKTWVGKIYPVVANCPAPGRSVDATFNAAYDITFSRPRERQGGGGVVQSSYWCKVPGDTSGGGGCPFHGKKPGQHDIVRKTGNERIDFTIYSIDVKIREINCEDGKVILHADPFPSIGGKLEWATPFGNFIGNDIEVDLGQNMPPVFNVAVKFTIDGVSVIDQKVGQKAKLIAFTLPCCSDKSVNVKDIANLQFDGPCKPVVVFNPAVLDVSGFLSKEDVTVTATVDGVVLTATITMVNPNKKLTNRRQSQGIRQGLVNTIAAWRRAIFENVLANALNGGVAPCEPRGNINPAINYGQEFFNICCPKDPDCVLEAKKFFGSLNWNYGVNCHFPVWGCPYVASLDAVVSAGVAAKIELNGQTTCTNFKICAGVEFRATVGGGVGATILGGAVSADLQLLVDGLGLTGELCFFPLPVTACGRIFLGRIKIAGTVQLAWGLSSKTIEYVIYSGYSTPNICFL
jgi:hypothetical protein